MCIGLSSSLKPLKNPRYSTWSSQLVTQRTSFGMITTSDKFRATDLRSMRTE